MNPRFCGRAPRIAVLHRPAGCQHRAAERHRLRQRQGRRRRGRKRRSRRWGCSSITPATYADSKRFSCTSLWLSMASTSPSRARARSACGRRLELVAQPSSGPRPAGLAPSGRRRGRPERRTADPAAGPARSLARGSSCRSWVRRCRRHRLGSRSGAARRPPPATRRGASFRRGSRDAGSPSARRHGGSTKHPSRALAERDRPRGERSSTTPSSARTSRR